MMFTNGLLSAGSRGADPARGKGAAAARAWLAYQAGERPSVDIILPGTGTRMFMGGRGSAQVAMPELLGVYPNPTKGEAYITYQLPDGAEQGTIDVMDATGRVVMHRSLQGGGGIVEMPKVLLAPGMYAVGLKADGIAVATSKFISLR